MLLLYLTIGVLSLYIIFLFNRIVRDKNLALSGWRDIDVQLKLRHDLIPKLVDTVKHYAKYEQATLEHVTLLRQQSNIQQLPHERSHTETDINRLLSGIFILSEQYPDIKASDHFQSLFDQLVHVEDQIQYARRFYNGAVKNYNTRIESFPDIIIARIFGFKLKEYFQIENTIQG